MNSWQARWTLFFNCFNFVLSYWSDSKNNKADVLSRQFAPLSDYILSTSFLPQPRFMLPRMTMKERWLCITHRISLLVCLFPSPYTLQFCHSSCLSCHLGVTRAIFVVKQAPLVVDSDKRYLGACPRCPTCAHCKTSRKQPFIRKPKTDRNGRTKSWRLGYASSAPGKNTKLTQKETQPGS